MLRKIVVLILSVFIGLAFTAFSTRLSFNGLTLFMSNQNGGCGDHWGGLPFAYTYTRVKPTPLPIGGITPQPFCVGVSNNLPMFIDWFIWTFASYVGIESIVKRMKRRRSQH